MLFRNLISTKKWTNIMREYSVPLTPNGDLEQNLYWDFRARICSRNRSFFVDRTRDSPSHFRCLRTISELIKLGCLFCVFFFTSVQLVTGSRTPQTINIFCTVTQQVSSLWGKNAQPSEELHRTEDPVKTTCRQTHSSVCCMHLDWRTCDIPTLSFSVRESQPRRMQNSRQTDAKKAQLQMSFVIVLIVC